MSATAVGISLFEDDQSRAERLLLDLADYIYGHTSLKPMSKTLFAISRCLLIADEKHDVNDIASVRRAYAVVRERLGSAAPEDDYSFDSLLEECHEHVGRIMSAVVEVRQLTRRSDALGLAFNSLLRGKIEGGEGLGTYLTPEEVVVPMVQMSMDLVGATATLKRLSEGALFGDICGGTGRFVFALAQELRNRDAVVAHIERSARLYDQSRLAVDLARINFVLQGANPRFSAVKDSLTEPAIERESGRYLFLATNPPFGTAKYALRPGALPWLDPVLLKEIAATGRGGAVDPAILFLIRNLQLLSTDGVLAIVLPDGIARAPMLRGLLQKFEIVHRCGVDLCASISLPVVTFMLGGTVAKTSFLILRKTAKARQFSTFVAQAKHVGFLKRGNRRAVDSHGNDLTRISQQFAQFRQKGKLSAVGGSPNALSAAGGFNAPPSDQVQTVGTFADLVKVRAADPNQAERAFHISILDVDETGFIDIIAASRNEPGSRGTACKPGDVILSCINPRLWRVTVVPDMRGDWSCSSEFVVLRPRDHKFSSGLRLAAQLHHRSVMDAVRDAATGTSSSRQRVPKAALMDVSLRDIRLDLRALEARWRERIAFYEDRLKEATAYQRLHQDGEDFSF